MGKKQWKILDDKKKYMLQKSYMKKIMSETMM